MRPGIDCAPFVRLNFGAQHATTSTQHTSDPVWNESFLFDLRTSEKTMNVEVCERDPTNRVSRERLLGQLSCEIPSIVAELRARSTPNIAAAFPAGTDPSCMTMFSPHLTGSPRASEIVGATGHSYRPSVGAPQSPLAPLRSSYARSSISMQNQKLGIQESPPLPIRGDSLRGSLSPPVFDMPRERLTSTAPGATILCQGENPPHQVARVLFDPAAPESAKWIDWCRADSRNRSSWIQYAYPEGERHAVSKVVLTSADEHPERDPRDWRLFASNAASPRFPQDFVKIDERRGESFSQRRQSRAFCFPNETPYRCYRLVIDCVRDPGQANACSLGACGLIELEQPEWDTAADLRGTLECQGEDRQFACRQAFDPSRDPQAKWIDWSRSDEAHRSSWVMYTYPGTDRHTVTKLELTSSDGRPECDPRDWSLWGSNAPAAGGSNSGEAPRFPQDFVKLDERANEVFPQRNQRRVFEIANTMPYRCYLLKVDSVADPPVAEAMALGHVALLEVRAPPPAQHAPRMAQPVAVFSPPSPHARYPPEPRMGLRQGEDVAGGQTARGCFEGREAWVDWCRLDSRNRSSWVQYQYGDGSRYVVSKVVLTSADEHPERDPRDWRLFASNAASPRFPQDFVKIDERRGETWSRRGLARTFIFANALPYSTYRLVIDCVRDAARANAMAIGRIELIAVDPPELDTARVGQGGEISCGGDAPPEHPAVCAFDGRADTCWLDYSRSDPAHRSRVQEVASSILAVAQFFYFFLLRLCSWIQYAYPEGERHAVSKVVLTSADEHPERDPRDWRLFASNAASPRFPQDFVKIDERRGEIFTSRCQARVFLFPNETPFASYRLVVDCVRDPPHAAAVALGNLSLIEVCRAPGGYVCVPPGVNVDEPERSTSPLRQRERGREPYDTVSGTGVITAPNMPSVPANKVRFEVAVLPGGDVGFSGSEDICRCRHHPIHFCPPILHCAQILRVYDTFYGQLELGFSFLNDP
ncbi:putative coagulation factor 5/8 type protein [Paratrimastix pyriformis]|uniref:Coagulation factor 5/8 type protein n=1 Tax=Paratrimastix pyriformis TaxID=342808 RepID=A0ABQ8UG62_9EUKA|nr:putative coagulation factor 5/8 type protein [Paratrimastix pyriformis]